MCSLIRLGIWYARYSCVSFGDGMEQARIFDFTRRFNEAAGRYHELSFDGDIAEEERIYML